MMLHSEGSRYVVLTHFPLWFYPIDSLAVMVLSGHSVMVGAHKHALLLCAPSWVSRMELGWYGSPFSEAVCVGVSGWDKQPVNFKRRRAILKDYASGGQQAAMQVFLQKR